MRDKFTPEFIDELDENEVFVFGSNKEGKHIGGAAAFAMDNFGAVQGNEIAVLSGNGKDGFLKVVTGDDNQVYIEFLDDNGINSIKPGALITDLSDIDGALA